MSATAFQRRRREIKAQKEQVEISSSSNSMTVKNIKISLDVKGIEYDPKAKKEELIKLLEGAE